MSKSKEIKKAEEILNELKDNDEGGLNVDNSEKLKLGTEKEEISTKQKNDELSKPNEITHSHIHTVFNRFTDDPRYEQHSHHAETLLDEAADLLDRAITSRSIYDTFSEKWLNLYAELSNEYENLQIERGRIIKGGVELAYRNAKRKLGRAERALSVIKIDEKKATENFKKAFSINNKIELYEAAFWSSWLSGVPAYLFQGQKNPSLEDYEIDGVNTIVSSHLASFNSRRASINYDMAQFSALNQLWQLQNSRILSSYDVDTLKWNVEWEQEDINFKKETYKARRAKYQKKVNSFNEASGALNHRKYLANLKKSYVQDLNEALDRLSAIHKNLYLFYDVRGDYPTNYEDVDFPGELRLWVRKAIQTVKNSVRSEVTTSVIFEVPIDEEGHGVLSVEEQKFVGLKNPRLRGISVFLGDESKKKLDYVSALIRLANEEDDSDWNLRLDRITRRSIIKTPMIYGSNILKNKSSVDEWDIKLFDALLTSGDGPAVNPKRIFIEMHVVGKFN
ncbi:MAG: hypothetical protein JJ964_10420 [Rhizobiales bacterium]|nr:hypothetical protein [Hyphomicrobiales bacterium]